MRKDSPRDSTDSKRYLDTKSTRMTHHPDTTRARTHTPAHDETLPVSRENATDEHTYLIVEPSTDCLSPATVVRQFRRLHGLGADGHSGGLLGSLLSGRGPPTVECLIISTGRDEDGLTYAFSVDDPEALPTLEQILRGVFPRSYTITPGTAPAHQFTALFGDGADSPADASTPTHEVAPVDALAAVEFHGAVDHHRDWQTALTPFAAWYGGDRGGDTDTHSGAGATDSSAVPLTAVVETMATASIPMAYQALIQPYPDWLGDRDARQEAIQSHMDSIADQVIDVIMGPPETDRDVRLSMTDQGRLEDLASRDPQHSFVVTARVLAGAWSERTADTPGARAAPTLGSDAPTPRQALRSLVSVLKPVSGTTHRIDTTVRLDAEAAQIRERMRERQPASMTYEQLRDRLTGSIRSRGILADAREVGSFCLLDGARLSTAGRRALAPTPPDRTPVARPPEMHLARYRAPGFLLGHPVTADGQQDPQTVSVPLSLQDLHMAVFGRTGGGKSTLTLNGAVANDLAKRAATADDHPGGATVAILPKSDRMGFEYCRAHFLDADHDGLDHIRYFDCAEWLPAVTFFDIRAALAAGVPRATAVNDVRAHYFELLRALVGPDQFDRAVRSPDIIQYLVKAQFDPVHGHDAFPHRQIRAAAVELLDGTVPPVSDPELEGSLAGVAHSRREELAKLIHGVLNRVEKVPIDDRLAAMMNHVVSDAQALGEASSADDPHFDFGSLIDENVVVVFDMGRLRPKPQQALSLLLLSNLWSALRRRRRRAPASSTLPLVNVYIEEAATIAETDLVSELLAQGRGFAASMLLTMQFPAQLRDRNEEAYREVLNNVSTLVTGNVAVDRDLAERFASADRPAETVRTRLRGLRRGQWFVSLPAPFGEPQPEPFLLNSAPLPSGHPDGPRPLTDAERSQFEATFDELCDRTRRVSGLELSEPGTVDHDESAGAAAGSSGSDGQSTASMAAESDPVRRLDSALPYTTRLPDHVWHDVDTHSLRCLRCDNRYDPSPEGMKRAICCCGSFDEVDRDDIPICELNVKLSPEEVTEADITHPQLRLLQACFNAAQGQYEPFEYDIQYDSMLRLQEYVGASADDVEALIEANLLRKTDHPHRLYTVTPDGRTVLGEGYRQGLDFGDGQGDLEESAEHVLGVRVGERLLEEVFVADEACPATSVKAYHDIDDQRRLDIAALDDDGDVVVAVEVERVNHDVRRAAPADFDKMADCGAQEAIWIVMSQREGHTVLEALNDPLEGKQRVDKTYSNATHPQEFRIDTPGLTAMYPVTWLRKRLDDPEWEWNRLRNRDWS